METIATSAFLKNPPVLQRITAIGAVALSLAVGYEPARSQTLIHGTIIDQATRAPIPLVNVILSGERYGAATDTLGYFAIRNVPEDLYVIEFRHVAYKRRFHVLRINAGDSITVAVELMEEPIVLPEIAVTAPAEPTRPLHQTFASTVVTFEQIEKSGARRLTDVLRSFEPGATTGHSPRGARRISPHERIPFMIYLDGQYVQYVPGAMDHIVEVSQIERIEISRWVGAAPNFGPGTSDRVIQIFTKRPKP
jgi:hypothetical protein